MLTKLAVSLTLVSEKFCTIQNSYLAFKMAPNGPDIHKLHTYFNNDIRVIQFAKCKKISYHNSYHRKQLLVEILRCLISVFFLDSDSRLTLMKSKLKLKIRDRERGEGGLKYQKVRGSLYF